MEHIVVNRTVQYKPTKCCIDSLLQHFFFLYCQTLEIKIETVRGGERYKSCKQIDAICSPDGAIFVVNCPSRWSLYLSFGSLGWSYCSLSIILTERWVQHCSALYYSFGEKHIKKLCHTHRSLSHIVFISIARSSNAIVVIRHNWH